MVFFKKGKTLQKKEKNNGRNKNKERSNHRPR